MAYEIDVYAGTGVYSMTITYTYNGQARSDSDTWHCEALADSGTYVYVFVTPESGYTTPYIFRDNGTGSSWQYPSDNTITANRDRSITVSATRSTVYKYDISYNPNLGHWADGSGTSRYTAGSASDWATTSSTAWNITPSYRETPTREGYKFLGWSKSSSATSPSSTVTIYASTDGTTNTLYAVWQKLTTYYDRINYYANGGSFGGEVTTARADHEYTNNSPKGYTLSTELSGAGYSNPTRDGYVFKGWAYKDSTTLVVTVSITPNTDRAQATVSVYAVWEERYRYNIVYGANGGTWSDGTTENKTMPASGYFSAVTASVTVMLTSSNCPTPPAKPYYDFDGWMRNGDTTKYKLGNNITFTAEDQKVHQNGLYATWTKKKIKNFYWDLSDGSNDTTLIQKGANVSNITAERWNTLVSKIEEIAGPLGVSYSGTRVSSGNTFTAAIFNNARGGISSCISAAENAGIITAGSVSLCGQVVKNQTDIVVGLFLGYHNGSLKSALNQIIDAYNNAS